MEAASPRAWGHPLCVCATQPGVGCGVCVCSSWGREGASPARDTAQTGGGPPHAQHRMGERVRAMADAGGGARALEPKAMRVVAQVCGWRGEGITVREGPSTGVAGRRVGGVFLGWSPRPVGGGRGGQVCCTPWGSGPCVYRRRGSRLGCEVTRISTRERSQGPPSNVTMACIGLFGRGTHAAFVSELDEDDVCTHSLRRHLHLPKRRRNVTTDGTFANATARTGNHFLFELCRHPYREISLSCGERFPF